jgi:hypothetical protein
VDWHSDDVAKIRVINTFQKVFVNPVYHDIVMCGLFWGL